MYYFLASLLRLPCEFLDFLLSYEPYTSNYSLTDLSSEPETALYLVLSNTPLAKGASYLYYNNWYVIRVIYVCSTKFYEKLLHKKFHESCDTLIARTAVCVSTCQLSGLCSTIEYFKDGSQTCPVCYNVCYHTNTRIDIFLFFFFQKYMKIFLLFLDSFFWSSDECIYSCHYVHVLRISCLWP